jgi:hypothetical protein
MEGTEICGDVAVRAPFIPPFANDAKDGAPELLWLYEKSKGGAQTPRASVRTITRGRRQTKDRRYTKGRDGLTPLAYRARSFSRIFPHSITANGKDALGRQPMITVFPRLR